MFDILIGLFNYVVFLKLKCYTIYVHLIENVKGSNISYFYLPYEKNVNECKLFNLISKLK